jgi:hypothetical protein
VALDVKYVNRGCGLLDERRWDGAMGWSLVDRGGGSR